MSLSVRVSVASAFTLVISACGGAVATTGQSPPATDETAGSSLTTFYARITLDGSQCLPQSIRSASCRVLVVSHRCVGEEGLHESETVDQDGIAALVPSPIEPGTRVCELLQLSPSSCTARHSPAWCYVPGSCELGSTRGVACEHAVCPSAGYGPMLAALGPAFLACDR